MGIVQGDVAWSGYLLCRQLGKGDGGGGCGQDAGLWSGPKVERHVEQAFEGKTVVPLERAYDFELNGILQVLSTVGMARALVARC